jgi:hypothetical protein
MLKRIKMAGKCVVLLAGCFCLFTLAQSARPLESIALLSTPGVAAEYHQLTRHTLKEVGSRVADLSAEAATNFGDLPLESSSRSPRVNQGDVPVRPAHKTVHRKIPPAPPDDAH